jgi:hypothetical protein
VIGASLFSEDRRSVVVPLITSSLLRSVRGVTHAAGIDCPAPAWSRGGLVEAMLPPEAKLPVTIGGVRGAVCGEAPGARA